MGRRTTDETRRDTLRRRLDPSGRTILRRMVLPSSAPGEQRRLALDTVIWSARGAVRLIRRRPEHVATERLRAGQAVRIDALRRRRHSGR